MVAATYDTAIAKVFQDEGGYSNHPNDPGGATNWGITINDARAYWKPHATPNDVRNMPRVVAEEIYRHKYAAPVRYDQLPAGFDYSVLDFGINSGVGRAIPYAASILGAPGAKIDALVPLAAAYPNKIELIQKYWAKRLSFLKQLRIWSTFGKGWGRRVATGEALAVKLYLKFGAKQNPASIKKEMEQQSKEAAAQSKIAESSAGASALPAGSGLTFDWAQISTNGKIAIACAGVALACVVIFFIYRAVTQSQRATAYAEAAE